MSYSYNQPDKDLRYAYVTGPRLYVATYDSASPPTYDGDNIVVLGTSPTGGDWIDAGVIMAASLPLTKNYVHREIGRPKTRRKTWEISRESRVEFTLSELIPETIGLLFGMQNTNKLSGSETTCSATPSRTAVTVASPSGLTVGMRVCTATLTTDLASSSNRAIISAIDGSDLTLAGTGFPVAPTTADKLRPYTSIEMLDAMDVVAERSVIVFWDWLEDNKQRQVAVWYPRMTATAPFSPDFKDNASPTDVKVTLEALATEQVVEDGTTVLVDRITYMFD